MSEVICTEDNNPCQHGGFCKTFENPTDNFCECPMDTNGNYCHQVLQPPGNSICTVNGGQCLNGGTCIYEKEVVDGKEVMANYCDCPIGTFGSVCHNEPNPSGLDEETQAAAEAAFAETASASNDNYCTENGNECQNGGFCVLKSDDGSIPQNFCVCKDGYSGNRCHGTGDIDNAAAGSSGPEENHFDKGTDQGNTANVSSDDVCTLGGNECMNGAECIQKDLEQNIPANYCKCAPGFFGQICKGKHSTPPPKPDPTPSGQDNSNIICTKGGMECQNGGVCVLGTDQFVMGEDNYCACPEETSGDRCEAKDLCPLDCQHGSSCRHTDDISHGNDGSGFYCECVSNYKGTLCEIPFEQCPITGEGPDLQCLFGGACIPNEQNDGGWACNCPTNRSGTQCQSGKVSTVKDYNGSCFDDDDCQNGGLCVKDHDAKETEKTGMETKKHQCLCALGFGGENCELRCTSLDCQHGSSCRFYAPDDITHGNDDLDAGAYCDCGDLPFKGKECEVAVQKCPGENGLECLYGGSCIGSQEAEDGDFYSCACPLGRTGKQCEIRDASGDKDLPFSNGNFPHTPKPPTEPGFNTISTEESQYDLDMNILVVSVCSAIFLLLIPVTLCCLKRHRDKKTAAITQESANDCLDGIEDISAATDTTNGHSNGHANGDVEDTEDFFDYDREGVVNVDLDENEPVPLPKDKQIV